MTLATYVLADHWYAGLVAIGVIVAYVAVTVAIVTRVPR